MNKLKENRGVSLSAFVITILVILLIVAVLGCVYFYKQNQTNVTQTAEEVQEKIGTIMDNITEKTAENKINKDNNTNTKNETNKKVSNVIYDRVVIDEENYYIKYTIYGKANNNENIWTYETEKGTEAQFDSIEILAITNDLVYINENGTIVALNKETGKKSWTYEGYKDTGSVVCFDSNDRMYIASQGGKLCIIDKNGKEIKTLEDERLQGEHSKVKLQNNEKEAIVDTYDGNVVIDLTNYSIK